MEMDLVKYAYEASQSLSNLRLILLWDEKLNVISISDGNYIALKIFLDNCKEKIDNIIDLIEKYCNDEEDIIGCPNCNYSITKRNYPKFCGNCGQALDWSE